jgi:transcriptional regulator with XRE-family HTH domain
VKNQANDEVRVKILALIESEYESDAAFERELGLQAKTVNNWRRGRSASFMKMLPALADSFEVSVGELLDVPITHDSSELSDDEIELLSLDRKTGVLSAKQKIALRKTLESTIELYLASAPDKKKSVKK